MANSPAYNRAIAKQEADIKVLVGAGYSLEYATKKAREWHPTPAQESMRRARGKRKGNSK